ncbi:MAG: hypothetical protein MSA68_04980 [Helicobacter sp.]|nr:hypothetical protein [Helicobacter sp.]
MAHATITNFENKRLIKGKKDGIAFFDAGGPLQTTITNLEIEKGIVKGEENGINLSRIEFDRRDNNGQGEKNERIVQNLTIKEGAAKKVLHYLSNLIAIPASFFPIIIPVEFFPSSLQCLPLP